MPRHPFDPTHLIPYHPIPPHPATPHPSPPHPSTPHPTPTQPTPTQPTPTQAQTHPTPPQTHPTPPHSAPPPPPTHTHIHTQTAKINPLKAIETPPALRAKRRRGLREGAEQREVRHRAPTRPVPAPPAARGCLRRKVIYRCHHCLRGDAAAPTPRPTTIRKKEKARWERGRARQRASLVVDGPPRPPSHRPLRTPVRVSSAASDGGRHCQWQLRRRRVEEMLSRWSHFEKTPTMVR